MKRTNIFYLFIVCLFTLVSCFEDDGNYDYIDMDANKITIRYPVYGLSVYTGDTVKFIPTLTYANKEQTDTNIYRWEYHFNYYGLVCTDREMKMVFDDAEVGKTYDGVVMAMDTTTGARFTQNISFRYQSRYTVGWVILSDVAGKSTLNLVKELNGEWETDKDIYKTIHNKELGTLPRRVFGNTGGRNEVRIIQDGPEGSLVLSGSDYSRLATWGEEFLDGTLPDGFEPKFMTTCGGYIAAMQGTDGKVYTKMYRGSGTSTYPYEYFVSVPMQLGNRVLDVQYLLNASSTTSTTYNLMLYDKGVNSFYMLYGASGYDAGKTYALKPPTTWEENDTVPAPDNLSNYEMLHCQMQSSGSYNMDIFALLKKKTTSTLYTYSFEYNSSSSNVYVSNITCKKVPEATTALMGDGTLFHVLRQRPYMFFIPANEKTKLYYYDPRTSRHILFKDGFGSPITAIESNQSTNTSLCIGLENGEVYLLDVSEEVMINNIEEEKVIYNSSVNGKVVDLFYKNY